MYLSVIYVRNVTEQCIHCMAANGKFRVLLLEQRLHRKSRVFCFSEHLRTLLSVHLLVTNARIVKIGEKEGVNDNNFACEQFAMATEADSNTTSIVLSAVAY